MARAIRHHRPGRRQTGRGNIIEVELEAAIRIAIPGVSRVQFNHLFRVLLGGVTVGSLPIVPVPVHDRDKVARGVDGRVEGREENK